MDIKVRKELETFLQAFAAEIEWGLLLRSMLERDEFELTHACGFAKNSWLLRAKPPRPLQEGFGLAPEILLLVIHGEVQARDLQRAAHEVIRSGFRLDGNLIVVTDDHYGLQERLGRLPGPGQRVAWVWNDDLSWAPLSEALRAQLPVHDVFEVHDPVRGYQHMGRDVEVAQLRTRISSGDAVGVFGLRKMGKTSLVRAVTDSLDPASGLKAPDEEGTDSRACVIWIDAQALDDATGDTVADEMLAALRRRMRAAHTHYRRPVAQGVAGLKVACEALLEDGESLCFVIDEYDYLFEREDGLGPVRGLSRLFRLLRAWAQQWQGAVSLVLIGRDPEHLSTPRLDKVTNPLLAWFTPMWLGPLVYPRDRELLRKLGRRVGLDIGHETASFAHNWTGGHPMLHRQFGSALLEEIRLDASVPSWKTPTDPYCVKAVERFRNREAVLTVDREILALLRKRYPTAYELLLDIAMSDDASLVVTRSGGLHASAGRVLRNFGLLDEATLHVPWHLLWYVRTLAPVPLRAAV
jgi:hypothetical protein